MCTRTQHNELGFSRKATTEWMHREMDRTNYSINVLRHLSCFSFENVRNHRQLFEGIRRFRQWSETVHYHSLLPARLPRREEF